MRSPDCPAALSLCILAVVNNVIGSLATRYRAVVLDDASRLYCSSIAIWEIAIKVRLGKLSIAGTLTDIEAPCTAFNIAMLSATAEHVIAEVLPEPATRDPFDRLLLAQAKVEGMRLVTIDRALSSHPLAWAPASPPLVFVGRSGLQADATHALT